MRKKRITKEQKLLAFLAIVMKGQGNSLLLGAQHFPCSYLLWEEDFLSTEKKVMGLEINKKWEY